MFATYSVCAMASAIAGYAIVAKRASPIPLLIFFLAVAFVSINFRSYACLIIIIGALIGAFLGFLKRLF
ncbi:hypothetical protein [Noviherbaspirillum galbum]|uniref:Uncharacterized protein n=1 Tax=Noviherbaspirillum galbum TaxID=2709383 RepID=A0A6B3SYM6_9BURK|nr:hypothetical protein [Noviherbaspirillum galbum]NEX64576.1 hypothetical protein [Noviherbaspirillum galbum]